MHEYKVYKKNGFFHLQNIFDTYPLSRVHYDSQTFVDYETRIKDDNRPY